MRIHYLFSDKKVVRSAIIHFNGEKQTQAILVDDKTGMLIRRKFKGALLDGNETLYGDLTIELPAGVKGGPYKTAEKQS